MSRSLNKAALIGNVGRLLMLGSDTFSDGGGGGRRQPARSPATPGNPLVPDADLPF